MMTYKGYAGRMGVDPEAGVIHGRVIGLRDVITFEGESVREAEQAFRDSIDDYLAFCEELGRPPERPHSGTLNVRLGAELHRQLAILAEAESVSINEKLRRLAEGAVREQFGGRPAAQPAAGGPASVEPIGVIPETPPGRSAPRTSSGKTRGQAG